MPPKNHTRFNVGRYMKLRKEGKYHALRENTKLLNCIENEERKLKTQKMKHKRLHSKVMSFKFDFYFGMASSRY